MQLGNAELPVDRKAEMSFQNLLQGQFKVIVVPLHLSR